MQGAKQMIRYTVDMIQILKSAPHPIHPQGSDVGYDLIAISEPNIVGGEKNGYGFYGIIQYIEYDTGVRLCGEKEREFLGSLGDHYSLIYPRSSISKYNLVLANSVGIIDPGFSDSIKVRFKYIAQPEDYKIFAGDKEGRCSAFGEIRAKVDESKIYKKGDKIAQLIFAAKFSPQIEFVDELRKTQRGTGGFGSTGV